MTFFESGAYTAVWRILFYFGFIVAIVGLIIRLKLDDSQLIEKLKGSKETLKVFQIELYGKALP